MGSFIPPEMFEQMLSITLAFDFFFCQKITTYRADMSYVHGEGGKVTDRLFLTNMIKHGQPKW